MAHTTILVCNHNEIYQQPFQRGVSLLRGTEVITALVWIPVVAVRRKGSLD